MTEPSPTEKLAGLLRIAAQVAAQYAEHLARRQEEQARATAAGHRHQADALRARLAAERDAARAAVAPTAVPGWWTTASREQVAHAWETARAWADTDPRLAATAAVIEAEIRARYGIDARELWDEVRQQAATAEATTAAGVLAADTTAARVEDQARAGRYADRPWNGPTPHDTFDPQLVAEPASVDLLAAWNPGDWDTPAARADRAAKATRAAGPDVEAAQAVTTADLSAGTPPQAAVAQAPRAPAPRKTRTRDRGSTAELGR